MTNRMKGKDELTAKMHSELIVSKETHHKHIVWTALDVIQSGLMTPKQAMRAYNLKEEDVAANEEEKPDLNR